MRAIALVPFYGGGSGPGTANGNAPLDARSTYLRRTLQGLTGFADTVVVGRVLGDNTLPAQVLSAHPDVFSVPFACEPRFLPANLCRYVQTSGSLLPNFSYVYVTEADQVVHLADVELAALVNGGHYLIPHRLEQLGPRRQGANRGIVVAYDDTEYANCNGAPSGDFVYTPSDRVSAYGGAFLASTALFRDIVFPDSAEAPVETVTGFAAFKAGSPLKTSDVLGFFVEHLSGYDYHCTLP